MKKLNFLISKLRETWMDLPYRRIANYNLNGYRRIYHVHIRKTGGTSLNHMFLALSKKLEQDADAYSELSQARDHRIVRDGKVYVGWNVRLINQGNYFYAFSHVPWHNLKLPPNTFTVAILRDPVKRVLSHYKMLVEYRDNAIDHPVMKVEGAWLGESFDDFLEHIPSADLLRQLYMFSPTLNVDEAYSAITSCSHFMFTEDFDVGISSLNAKLGICLKPIHIRQTKSAPLISERQISKLRDLLAREYELVARLKEHPFVTSLHKS